MSSTVAAGTSDSSPSSSFSSDIEVISANNSADNLSSCGNFQAHDRHQPVKPLSTSQGVSLPLLDVRSKPRFQTPNGLSMTSSTTLGRLQVNAPLSTPSSNRNQQTMYRLSSFNQINQASLLKNDSLNQSTSGCASPGNIPLTPTYESIDAQNLSHLGYNAPLSDYCAVSGASSSEGQSTSACMSDPTITVPDNHRLYPADPLTVPYRGSIGGGTSGYLTRTPHYYPHPSDSSAYYPVYGRSVCPPKEEDFDIFNAIFALISLTSYLCCTGSCLILCYFLCYHEKDHRMFSLTLGIVLLPSIIVNILSLKWLLTDNHHQHDTSRYSVKRPHIGPCGWMLRIMVHIFLLGPVLRYVELLRYGVKSWTVRRKVDQQKEWPTVLPSLSTTLPRPRFSHIDGLPNFEPASKASNRGNGAADCDGSTVDYYLLTVYEDRDTSLLSLFHSLMQCSGQLVLQLYSLMAHYQFRHVNDITDYNHQFTEYVQIAVITLCLFEISWSLASYHRALRRASYEKRNLGTLAVLAQWVWHCGVVGSRVLSIALFVHQFGYWLCPITVGHWGVMTVWIMHQGTHFFDDHLGNSRLCAEYLFNMLLGVIYLFVFVNVKDEPTRYKYSAFYSICLAENLLFAGLWFVRVDAHLWFRLPAVVTVAALFAVGMVAMQAYYWLFHPNGRPLLINKAARCC